MNRMVPIGHRVQTFKLDNLRKYEHMGFQLSKEVASDTIPLICYHMIHP